MLLELILVIIQKVLIKLYPRLEKISKWDIAAGHAIVNAAGGLASITNIQTDYRVNAKFTTNIIE